MRQGVGRSLLLMVVVAACRFAPCLGAQSVIMGRVVGDSSRRPLAGAEVFLSGSLIARSDSEGRFGLPVESGTTRLDVRRLGFEPQSQTVVLRRGETLAVTLHMVPKAVSLDSITVRGSPRRGAALLDFETRRQLGIGRFLSDSALRTYDHGAGFTSLLRRWGIGVHVTRRGEQLATTARGPTRMSLGPCPMQVFLDGVMLGQYDLRSVRVTDLAGVEYYAGGSQTPVIFEKGSSACGVLVLWTRVGIR